MISRIILFIILLLNVNITFAHEYEIIKDSDIVQTNSFGDNWYAQIGADINLIFPKGHDMKDVFPILATMGKT